MQTFKLKIESMNCGACVRHVTRAIDAVPGAKAAQVAVGSAVVSIDPRQAGVQMVIDALTEAGYPARTE